MLYLGEETFEVQEREARAPGGGEVQVAVAYVGICGTDLHIKHGAMDGRVSIPGVIGHEMSGTGARVYERRDFERAVQMLASGEIPAAQLISAVESLERTPDAFAKLESGEEVVKVLIDCRETQ